MANNRHWTEEEIGKLLLMKTNNFPVQAIAEVLDRTDNAVQQKLNKMGYSTRVDHRDIREYRHEVKPTQIDLLQPQEKRPVVVPKFVAPPTKPKEVVELVWVLSRRTKPSALSRAWHWLFGREWRSIKHKRTPKAE